MIEHTKKLVEEKFTVLGGYEHNAEVSYLHHFILFHVLGRLRMFIFGLESDRNSKFLLMVSGYLWRHRFSYGSVWGSYCRKCYGFGKRGC